MKKSSIVLASLFIAFTATQAVAEDKGRRGPPPEAFEVCEGQSEGASVSFTTPKGDSVEATCKLMREKLVAVPDNMPEKKGRPE